MFRHIHELYYSVCFFLLFQPRENFNEWRLIYFISFLLLVGFFVLNMFVGVVVENFHRCRAEQEKEERARRAAKRAKKIEERRRSMKNSFFDLFIFIISTYQSHNGRSIDRTFLDHFRTHFFGGV